MSTHHCKLCTIVTALAEYSKVLSEKGDEGESTRVHCLANEVGIMHAAKITNEVEPDFTLPDGSTLGDWVAAARSVHGLSVPDDVEAE
jgi:hypothetical protein